jgi:hypothetical protein
MFCAWVMTNAAVRSFIVSSAGSTLFYVSLAGVVITTLCLAFSDSMAKSVNHFLF